MENNVLGIKIFNNLNGFKELFQHNSSSILDKCCEDNLRDFYGYMPDAQKRLPLTLLTGMQDGYLITVMKYTMGTIREDDSVSAWIYVPANTKISGKELSSVVENVKEVIMSDGIDFQRLVALFSRTYETISGVKTCFKSAGSGYAYRYYGPNASYSLSEILNDMNQSVYKDYKRVILLDNSLNQKINTGRDISNEKILERCKVMPPEPVDGFRPYYRDILFDRPLIATEQDKFTVVWKKDGFKPINKSYVVSKGCVCEGPARSEMVMLIRYDSIIVRDNAKILSEYTLDVNNARVKKGEIIEISVDAIEQTRIRVVAEGYDEYIDIHDLSYRRADITLNRKTYTYTFVVYSPTQNDKIEFPCSLKTALRKSPFEGYSLVRSKDNSKRVHLKYRLFTKKIIIILTCLSLLFFAGGAVGAWFLAKNYFQESVPSTEEQTTETSTNVESSSGNTEETSQSASSQNEEDTSKSDTNDKKVENNKGGANKTKKSNSPVPKAKTDETPESRPGANLKSNQDQMGGKDE